MGNDHPHRSHRSYDPEALFLPVEYSCPLCILANERSERGSQIPPDSLVINRLYADLISIKLTQILSDRPRVLRNWTLTA